MRVTTDNGTVLDSEELAAPTLNGYIRQKDLKNLLAVVATTTDGRKEYVVIDRNKSEYVYHSQSLESVGVWLDLYKFSEESDHED